jgi:stage III sporulation protein AA
MRTTECEWKNVIPPLMPQNLREALLAMDDREAGCLREIRIAASGPVAVVGRTDGFLENGGAVSTSPLRAVCLRPGECERIFDAMTGHARYACVDDICRGFVTMPGGYRVGLGGEVACRDGRVTYMKSVSSLNIRIARAVRGAADPVMPLVAPGGGTLRNTLVVSPPGMGKTTMIRDIARQLSDGTQRQGGVRVAVIDERGEIGGCREGAATMDIGLRTDILDGCPKPQGLLWAVRSLAPRAVITDEIGTAEDAEALLEARNAGVAVVASVHAAAVREVFRRPSLAPLIREALFDLYILLGPDRPGAIREIVRGERAADAFEMAGDRAAVHGV